MFTLSTRCHQLFIAFLAHSDPVQLSVYVSFSRGQPAEVQEQITREEEIIRRKWEVVYFWTMTGCEGQWEPR